MKISENIIENIKQNNKNFIFIGDDLISIRETIKEIKSKYLSCNYYDFNYDIFFADETDISDVIKSAKSMPVFDKERVVVFYNIENLDKDSTIKLVEYLKSPSPETILIMISQTIKRVKKSSAKKKEDKKEKTADLMELSTVTKYDFQIPTGKNNEELRYFIKDYLKSKNYNISEKTLDVLVLMYNEENKTEVLYELENLMNFTASKKEIDIEAVNKVISKTKQFIVFDLTRYIIQGNTKEALECFENISEGKAGDVSILSFIETYLRKIILLHHLVYGKNHSFYSALGTTKLFYDKFLEKILTKIIKKMPALIEILTDTDYKIKKGKGDIQMLLFQMIYNMSQQCKI